MLGTCTSLTRTPYPMVLDVILEAHGRSLAHRCVKSSIRDNLM